MSDTQRPDLPAVRLEDLDEWLVVNPMPSLVLGTDGREYELLWWAACSVAPLPGLTAEVGVREGGASELILRAAESLTHVCIDPYGNIPYADRDDRVVPGFGYDEEMRRNTQASLSIIANSLGRDLLFLPMEDSEFMDRFTLGVPLYLGGSKRVVNEYRLVHIDGPHAFEPVAVEAAFFGARMVEGGYLVFDNIDYYDHGRVHREVLAPLGFELVHVGESKAVHRRVGS